MATVPNAPGTVERNPQVVNTQVQRLTAAVNKLPGPLFKPGLVFGNTFFGDDGLFHAIPAPPIVAVGTNYIDPRNAPFNAKFDGVSNDTPALQAAGNAAILAGLPLFIPPSVNGANVRQDGSNPWCLRFAAPIEIFGGPGYGILMPDASVPDTASIIYLVGSGNTFQRTVISGVMIANPSSATRHGNHAVVFDTLGSNQLFLRPIIRDCYFQSPVSSNGFSVFVNNSAVNNPNGGFAYGRFIHNFIGSGVNLGLAGDSIVFEGANTFSGSTVNDGVYANLVTGAGNLQVCGNNFGINGSAVHIDYANTFDLSGNEIEHNNASSTNALINIAGAVGRVAGGSITNNEFTVIQGVSNQPLILNMDKTDGVVVDHNKFATFTPYIPWVITANAGAIAGVKVGGNNYFETSSTLRLTDNSQATVYPTSRTISGHTPFASTGAPNTTFFVGSDISTSEQNVYLRAPYPGCVIKNLEIYFGNGAPGVGQSYACTLMKNGLATAVTATVSGGGNNSAGDIIHQASYTVGDQFSIRVVSSAGAATAQNIQYTLDMAIF